VTGREPDDNQEHADTRSGFVRSLAVTVLSALAGVALASLAWYGGPIAWDTIKAHPYFAVPNIEVDGNLRLSRQEILEWAGIADGMSIWDAPPGALRLRLQKNPWVERARVRREFPNELSIHLQERRPVALAQLETLSYVDRRGHVLGPLRQDDSRDFVIITGLREADDFAAIGLHRAVKLLRLCERLNCFESVSEVQVDRQRGLAVFPMHVSVEIVLGWGGWRGKLARSGRVLAAWHSRLDQLATIDVSFQDIAVVRLRQAENPAQQLPAKRGTRI